MCRQVGLGLSGVVENDQHIEQIEHVELFGGDVHVDPSAISSCSRKLTRPEVLTYTAVLAGAGNETTGRLIGWLAKLLAEHPDQRRQVVEDRTLIPRVIDETLRFEPTGHSVARCVTHDVEYHGTTIPAGSPVLLSGAAANRDHMPIVLS